MFCLCFSQEWRAWCRISDISVFSSQSLYQIYTLFLSYTGGTFIKGGFTPPGYLQNTTLLPPLANLYNPSSSQASLSFCPNVSLLQVSLPVLAAYSSHCWATVLQLLLMLLLTLTFQDFQLMVLAHYHLSLEPTATDCFLTQ